MPEPIRQPIERLKPEDFLRLIEKSRLGKLKIYLGHAAGVGKTYAMLEEAHRLKKAGVDVTAVSNVAIWGNHSATQYPDFYNARINGKLATVAIRDEAWLQGEFISTVQQRGAAVIKARGLSSAASAANAVVDSVRSIIEPTRAGDWHSVSVCSDGSYGVEKGLISSFPVRSNGQKVEIVPGVPVNEFSRAKIDATVNELQEEKAMVADLLPK